MKFDLQPTLENDVVKLIPLKESDFEILYLAASDPLIWEQHPDRFRYKRDVFEKYFEGALKSDGSFLIVDRNSREVIGSSRYYDSENDKKSIAIGYTFIARKYWGTDCNRAVKNLMLEHAFKSFEKVIFHIGEKNIRSQKAIEKLGAKKTGEQNRQNSISFVYEIDKNTWMDIRNY